MAAENIGTARSGSGRTYTVRWDSTSKDVYVNYGGGTRVGTANSAAQAMRVADAWLTRK